MADNVNNYTQTGKVATQGVSTSSNNATSNEYNMTLKGNTEYNNVDESHLFNLNMSQSAFFTLEISKIPTHPLMNHIVAGKLDSNDARGYGSFLPVKSLSYRLVSLENKSFNAGMFSDLLILEKRKTGMLDITLLDTSDDRFEQYVTSWFNLSGYNDARNGYIGYIVDWAAECNYCEYSVTGLLNKRLQFMVLPSGEPQVSRSYEDNKLKEISFSVAIASSITSLKK